MGTPSAQLSVTNEESTSKRVQHEEKEAACSYLFDHRIDSSPLGSDFGRKRKRKEDSDSDSEFYGFAADSFVFQDAPVFEESHLQTAVKPIRKSKRILKKRRKEDYVYYK